MAKKKKATRRKGGEARHPPPPPKCKALLLCDQAIEEAGTRKISLIGVFGGFRLRGFPGDTRACHAFLQLIDGIGRTDIVVEVHDLREDTVLARAKGLGIEIPSRLTICNIIIPIPSLRLRHEGKYDFVVFVNGQEVERQQFEAMEPPAEKQS